MIHQGKHWTGGGVWCLLLLRSLCSYTGDVANKGNYHCLQSALTMIVWSRYTRLPEVIWEQAASPTLVGDPVKAATPNRSTVLASGCQVHVHLIHDSLGLPHSPSQTVQPFLHGRCHIVPIHYTAPPQTSQNWPLTPENPNLHLIHRCLDPPDSPLQTEYRSSQSSVYNSRSLSTDGRPDRPTERTRNSSNNRPPLTYAIAEQSNIKTIHAEKHLLCKQRNFLAGRSP